MMTATKMPNESDPRRPLQFGIRSLLILTTVAAILFAVLAQLNEWLRIAFILLGSAAVSVIVAFVLNRDLARLDHNRWLVKFVVGFATALCLIMTGVLGTMGVLLSLIVVLFWRFHWRFW